MKGPIKTFFIALFCFALSSPVQATTFVVTRTDDHDPPDAAPNGCNSGGSCSLREAVLAANADSTADIIQLDALQYDLDIPEAGNASSGDLNVTQPVTFQGAGQMTTIIKGVQPDLNNRILDISASGVVNIFDLTIQGGDNNGAVGGGISATNTSTVLNLTNCQVIGNTGGNGAGIFASTAQLNITNCQINNNVSENQKGGGISFESPGSMTIIDSVLNENEIGPNGDGAGIYFSANGNLTLQNTEVSENRLFNGGDGAGIFFTSAAGGGLSMVGGRISQNEVLTSFGFGAGLNFVQGSSLRLENVIIEDNTALDAGGDGGGVFCSSVNGDVEIIGGRIHNNRVLASGAGGLHCSSSSGRVHLDGVEISGNQIINTGTGAGAVFTSNEVLVENSVFSGNRLEGDGTGGGIFSSATTLKILGSTFSDNFSGGFGGALVKNTGTLEITNSTFSNNQANGNGGALNLAADVSLNNVTLADNKADLDGNSSGAGGGLFIDSGTVTLRNSILFQNADGEGSPDCLGALNSEGYNLIGDGTGCTITPPQGDPASTDLYGVDPLLGALANNGGLTQTRALASGSPAIDAGNPAGCTDGAGAPLTTDQRGLIRPSGPRCDIGAFEVQPIVPIAPDLSILKTVSVPQAAFGEEITYMLLVKNEGLTEAQNVEVTDPLAGALAPISATPTSGNCTITNNTVVCSTPSLGAGETLTITLVVKAVGDGVVANIAFVTVPGDPNPGNNSSTVNVTVSPGDLGGGGCGLNPSGTASWILMGVGWMTALLFRRRRQDTD